MEIKTAEQFLLQKYFALEEENERLKDQLLDMERQLDEERGIREGVKAYRIDEPIELCSVSPGLVHEGYRVIKSFSPFQIKAMGETWGVDFYDSNGRPEIICRRVEYSGECEPYSYCPMDRIAELEALAEKLNADD